MKRFCALLTAALLLAAIGCRATPDNGGEITTTTTTASTTVHRNPDLGNQPQEDGRPSTLPAKTYALQTDDPLRRATITLAPYNDRFSIILPSDQTCQPYGTYRVSGDKLVLTADDSGGDLYVFRMTGDTLVFLASESTPFPAINAITDGAVFA